MKTIGGAASDMSHPGWKRAKRDAGATCSRDTHAPTGPCILGRMSQTVNQGKWRFAMVVLGLALAGSPLLASAQHARGKPPGQSGGQQAPGGQSRPGVPEFDATAAGAVAALLAGGGVLLARRRKKGS